MIEPWLVGGAVLLILLIVLILRLLLLFLEVLPDLFQVVGLQSFLEVSAPLLQFGFLHQVESENVLHDLSAYVELLRQVQIWQRKHHDYEIDEDEVVDQRQVVDQLTHLDQVQDRQQGDDELDKATDAVENTAHGGRFDAIRADDSLLLNFVTLDISEDVGENVLDQHEEEQSQTEVSVGLTEVDDGVFRYLRRLEPVFKIILPPSVDGVEENEANELHFEDALRVVQNLRVLHHVLQVGLSHALIVELLLGDATDDVLLDPHGCLLLGDRNRLSDLLKATFIEHALDFDKASDVDHTLLARVELLKISMLLLRHFGANRVGHESKVLVLEVRTDVLSRA